MEVIKRSLHLSYTGNYLSNRWTQITDLQTSKLLRFAIFVSADLLLGSLTASVIQKNAPDPDKLSDLALLGADQVVHYLRKLIKWLMGAPAGLKLNSVLSMCLGRFFLYHIHLWVTFLHVTTPHVSYFLTSYCLGVLSKCGLCLQLCVIQDAFNLITFHIHCFYAYARRLFVSQTSGLRSLWRLFRGKKYNPLRDRVDTSSNNVDQLFLGTLAFTILLFLYPTTLVYYVVFKVLEFMLTVINSAVTSVTTSLTNLASPPPEINPIIWVKETDETK